METSKPKQETWNQPYQEPQPPYSQDNKRVLTGVLAIILGSIGVHKFVLGYNNEGFIILIATVIGYATLCIFIGAFILTATSLLGLIEGIIYLTKTDADFYETYQKNKKPWF
jgi:TM2 domain-containing membrane protein YozV